MLRDRSCLVPEEFPNRGRVLRGRAPGEGGEAERLCAEHIARIARTMGLPERVNPHLLFPWVDRLCRSPQLLSAVSRALGTRHVLLWESAWFLKQPGSAEFVSFHQDSTYLGLKHGGRLTTAWIALTGSDAANGCPRVVEGSHAAGQLAHTQAADVLNQLSKGQRVAVLAVDPSIVKKRRTEVNAASVTRSYRSSCSVTANKTSLLVSAVTS